MRDARLDTVGSGGSGSLGMARVALRYRGGHRTPIGIVLLLVTLPAWPVGETLPTARVEAPLVVRTTGPAPDDGPTGISTSGEGRGATVAARPRQRRRAAIDGPKPDFDGDGFADL